MEIADVKSRQITEERLKHLQAALEDTSLKVKHVADHAHAGAQKGAERLIQQINEVSYDIKTTNSKAIQSLTDAHKAIQGSHLTQKRTIYLLLLFSTLFGLFLGASLAVRAGDYKMATEFGKSIKGPEADWFCRQAGGKIYVRDNGNFCGVWTN